VDVKYRIIGFTVLERRKINVVNTNFKFSNCQWTIKHFFREIYNQKTKKTKKLMKIA